MTEQEAKTKWCPNSMYVFGNGTVSGNRDGKSGDDGEYIFSQGMCNCLASGCMMWRWNRDAMNGGSGRAEPTKGYCGLACKP